MGLSVDDIAHRTRIHAKVIRGLEVNDLSRFPSITYAKGFLRKYSDFLDIDVSEEIQALESGESVSLKNSALMQEVRDTLENNHQLRLEQPRRYRSKVEKPGGAPVFLGFILVVLFLSIVVFYILGYNSDSPEEMRSEITRLSRATGLVRGEDPPVREDSDPAGLPPNPLARSSVASVAVAPAEDPDVRPDSLLPDSDAGALGREEREPSQPAREQPVSATDASGGDTATAMTSISESTSPLVKPEVDVSIDESPLEGQAEANSSNRPEGFEPRPEIPRIEIEEPAGPAVTRADIPALPRIVSPEAGANELPAEATPPLASDPEARERVARERPAGERPAGERPAVPAPPVFDDPTAVLRAIPVAERID